MIEVRDLRMAYRGASFRRWRDAFRSAAPCMALDGVSLNVKEGEGAAVVGANGAGKTTLLKILAGVVIPSEGMARVAGADVLREPLKAKRLLGFTGSQERSFYWRLTVRQNLDFFAALYDMPRPELQGRIEELAGQADLSEHLDAPFRNLSSGIQQRVGLVRALLHRPRVLLLDEPTRSLDPAAARRFLDTMERVLREQKITLLFSTHSPRDLGLARTVHVLRRGAFAWRGTPAALAAFGGGSMEIGLQKILVEGAAEDSS